MRTTMAQRWLAVDLDGVLAEDHGWQGETHIGAPIPVMVDRVKAWLAEGRDVRIFTARVCVNDRRSPESGQVADRDFAERQRAMIEAWCERHLGTRLPVTCEKDFLMDVLYDDRCVQVEKNTGHVVGDRNEDDSHDQIIFGLSRREWACLDEQDCPDTPRARRRRRIVHAYQAIRFWLEHGFLTADGHTSADSFEVTLAVDPGWGKTEGEEFLRVDDQQGAHDTVVLQRRMVFVGDAWLWVVTTREGEFVMAYLSPESSVRHAQYTREGRDGA